MGQKFSAKYGWRKPIGPENIIGETEIGQDTNTLIFPGISSCTSITFRCADRLVGVHLTIADDVSVFGRLIEGVKERVGPVLAVYHIGRLNHSWSGWNGQDGLGWPAQAATVKDLLGIDNDTPSYFAVTQDSWRDVRVTRAGTAVSAESRVRFVGNYDDGASWDTDLVLALAPAVG